MISKGPKYRFSSPIDFTNRRKNTGALHRGSYMSAGALLNLFNLLRKRDKTLLNLLNELKKRDQMPDSRPKGRGFEPHRRHCVVVLEQDIFILA